MKFSSLALAGAVALSVAGASLAQPAPGAAQSPVQAPAAQHGHGWRNMDPAQMAQKRAERLRAVLQLRADQEPALRSFLDATTPSRADLERRRAGREEMRNLTTPQRLDRMQQRMTERQARFARHADATRRFYGQLSPAQQKAFDALHQGRGGMHGGKHGGRGHGGAHHGFHG